jgi:hypothetical protein
MSAPAGVPPLPPLPPAESPQEREAREARTLERTWADAAGLRGWLTTVDHKRIAARYVVTAFAFFALGGLDALVMRTQLLRPENQLVGPDRYNQLFTVHGTNMMFLFAVPVMLAMGLYMVPLLVGARNVAFSSCWSARATWRSRASTRWATGSTWSAAACCGWRCCPTPAPTPAGSATCRSPAPSSRPASAWTCGLR